MQDSQADETFDARGRRCSMLSMMVAEKISPLAPGTVVEILTDDPGAPREMPAWCARAGHELLRLLAEGQNYRVSIRRGK